MFNNVKENLFDEKKIESGGEKERREKSTLKFKLC